MRLTKRQYKEARKPFVPTPELVTEPIRRNPDGVGRNKPCPCGGGRKAKKCDHRPGVASWV